MFNLHESSLISIILWKDPLCRLNANLISSPCFTMRHSTLPAVCFLQCLKPRVSKVEVVVAFSVFVDPKCFLAFLLHNILCMLLKDIISNNATNSFVVF